MLGDKVKRVLKTENIKDQVTRLETQQLFFWIVRAKESDHSRTAALVHMHSPTSVRETCAQDSQHEPQIRTLKYNN